MLIKKRRFIPDYLYLIFNENLTEMDFDMLELYGESHYVGLILKKAKVYLKIFCTASESARLLGWKACASVWPEKVCGSKICVNAWVKRIFVLVEIFVWILFCVLGFDVHLTFIT